MAANIKFPQPLNPDINEAIQQLDALAALIYAQSEQIQNREWQYWGYSQARAAIAFSKERYVDWMRTRVFMQHELDLSRTLANLPKESRTLAMAVYCEYLSWQNKILLAVDRKEEAPSPIADIDLAYTDRSGAALPLNNPALNRVFAVYILWETPQGRQRMRDYINAAIRKNIAVLSNYSDWISQWLHTRSLLSPVYMSKYWPQADPSWNISRAYTARARERMEQMLANLEEAAENKEVFQEMAAHYRRQYASEYRSAWWRMAADFNMGPAFFDTGAQWRNMAATMTGVDNPYFQFIQDMAENLKAVKDLAGRQPIDDLPAVFTSLIQESQSYSRDLTLGQRLEEVARGVSMRNLEEKAGAAFLNKASAKSENEVLFNKLFADYLKSLEPIYTNGNYEAQSMQMAQDGYSGGGKESAITAASLTAARALASGLDHNFTRHQIFWDLVEGPIAFLTYRAVYRSACYLNTMWENDILSKTYQVDAAKRWLILFAHDGLVSKFMQGPVKPFLKSTISGWTAAEWLGIAYPLQHEFIAFLNMANVDYNAPQAEYKVTFKAYPIAVNRQAEKPYLARLTLSSDSGSQVLENYNYPTKQTFTWKPAENSKVRMEIFFSGVSFSKEWFGPWAFRDFLRSFENSTLTLNRNDFPGNEEIMDELDMEYIELRYDIDGGKPVTRLTDPPVISALPLTAAFCYIGSSQNSVSSSLPVIHLAPLSAGGARNKP
jgi:type VI secretion system protein ImpL